MKKKAFFVSNNRKAAFTLAEGAAHTRIVNGKRKAAFTLYPTEYIPFHIQKRDVIFHSSPAEEERISR